MDKEAFAKLTIAEREDFLRTSELVIASVTEQISHCRKCIEENDPNHSIAELYDLLGNLSRALDGITISK